MIACAVAPGVGRLAGEHLVGHRAERVLIGPRVDVAVAGGLLRAHVVRRAEREAGLGDASATGLGYGQRDAEVGDHRLARLEQDVLRLEVAMDHAPGVGVVERAGHQRRPGGCVSSTGSCCSRSSRARSVSPSTNGMT